MVAASIKDRYQRRLESSKALNHKISWDMPMIERAIIEFERLPLTLPIEDYPMRRCCEAITKAGYRTTESCDGHGTELPRIWLKATPEATSHLAYVLAKEVPTRAKWGIEMVPKQDPKPTAVTYVVRPHHLRWEEQTLDGALRAHIDSILREHYVQGLEHMPTISGPPHDIEHFLSHLKLKTAEPIAYLEGQVHPANHYELLLEDLDIIAVGMLALAPRTG